MRIAILALALPLQAADYSDVISADAPVAHWRFDQATDCCAQEAGGSEALKADRGQNVSLIAEGPRSPAFPAFEAHNVAADFTLAPKAFLRVKDPGAKSAFDFAKGETITVEAWVQCKDPLKDWQFVYIAGKGRTAGACNQNWGLRLLGDGKLARASFIFSGATTGRFHRWNSNLGFAPGADWHHVAMSYEFGKPESIKAWIDGQASAGVWDDGGATADAPVVDDDEMWIGSSMGGQASSTFPGLIDEVAIYRRALGEDRIRVRAVRASAPVLVDGGPKSDATKKPVAKAAEPPPAPVPAITIAELPKDEVRVEIHEFPTTAGEDSSEFWTGDDSKKSTAADPSWAALPPRKTEQWSEPAWLLAATPNKYSERGVKTERSRPFLVRMAGVLTLPEGEHKLLLRALTGTRIALDGAVLTQTPLKKLNRQDNDPVPDQLEQQLVKTMPLLPPGHVEREVAIQSDGKPHVFVLESWIGAKSIRPEIGELFIAVKSGGGEWKVLGSEVSLSTGESGKSVEEDIKQIIEPKSEVVPPKQERGDLNDEAFGKDRSWLSLKLLEAKGVLTREEVEEILKQNGDASGSDSPYDRGSLVEELKKWRKERPKKNPDQTSTRKDAHTEAGKGGVQEMFVTAYLEVRRAEELQDKGETESAIVKLRSAKERLEKIQADHPEWQPELIAFRLSRTKALLEKLERRARGEKPAQEGAPKGADADPAQELYVNVFLSYRKAQELEAEGDWAGALKSYRAAEKARKALDEMRPAWRGIPLSGEGETIEEAIQRLEKREPARDGKSDPVKEEFVKVFITLRELEEKEKNGDIKGALEGFKNAAKFLKEVQTKHPDWQKTAVAFRLLEAEKNIKRLSGATGSYRDLVNSQRQRIAALDARNRRIPAEDAYWKMRHELARQHAKPAPAVPFVRMIRCEITNEVDKFLEEKFAVFPPARVVDKATFLRRAMLDTVGVIPTAGDIAGFVGTDPTKDTGVSRAQLVDRLLADPRWADHWTSYWQDVLAENPNIIKGTLNNTGPFRWWIHESLLDNKPMDRFVTELTAMEGSANYGGPAGFGIATQNDLPMAAKAQVLAGAFLANEMKCARCHDAVHHSFEQRELFQIAAMLGRAPLKVPETSLTKGLSKNSHVQVTLKAGEIIEPHMPFGSAKEPLPGVIRRAGDTRELLAAQLTDPRNERFAQVIVNRIWKRFMGFGIVEPVDDWETSLPSHPELLRWLAHEFVTHGYDVKHIARLILNSSAYQRSVTPDALRDVRSSERKFASQARRRLTAEQILDSLMLAAGQEYDTEMITFDPEARQNAKDQGNFGVPRRAWEFAALSNERDRPALAKPKAQIFTDVLTAFGWRESRPEPRSTRDHEANIIQPALLANGTFGALIARAHDDSAFTALALREQPLGELARQLYLTLLSREPSFEEKQRLVALLEPGYATRLTGAPRAPKPPPNTKAVSWASHLNPDATTAVLASEREVKAGPTPTPRLTSDWRDRFEDALWALLVSPEFAWVP